MAALRSEESGLQFGSTWASDTVAFRIIEILAMTEDVIRDLEEQLRCAQLNADVDALDALISDDLLFAGPDGAVVTKADDLAAYRDHVLRISSHQPEELHIRSVRADVFLVSLRARLSGVYADAAFSVRSRYMRVWARGPEGWRVVGGQVSAIPEDAAQHEV